MLVIAAGLALPAHAQLASDRVIERRAGDDYTTVETDFDFAAFVDKYQGQKVVSVSEFRSRLTKNDVCGKERDGVAGAQVDSMCALMFSVYEAPGGVRHVFMTPIFSLEAPDIGRNAQAAAQAALVIGPRGEPALVKFSNILPAAGAPPPNLNGQKVEGAFTFAYVVGRIENGKLAPELKVPDTFFDHRYHLR